MRDFVNHRLTALDIDITVYKRLLHKNPQEYDLFFDVVTINETYFFREERHFELLDNSILPQLKSTYGNGIRLWSAACSTGEEAVSLAALALKHWGPAGDISVYGTDLNSVALSVYQQGYYRRSAFRGDGSGFHGLLDRWSEKVDKKLVISSELKKKIHCFQANLFKNTLHEINRPVQIVFLRNILIYMPLDRRQIILENVADKVCEGGYLFLSSSEMPLISHPKLELKEEQGVYFFIKKRKEQITSGVSVKNDFRLLKKELPENNQVPSKEKRIDLTIQPPNRDIQNKQLQNREVQSSEHKSRQHQNRGRQNNEDQNTRHQSGDHPNLLHQHKQGKYLFVGPFDVNLICNYANKKLFNKLFEIENDIHYDTAIHYLRVIDLINDNYISEAARILNRIGGLVPRNEAGSYLRGYLEKADENNSRAENYFREALTLNHDFWPARFQLGMMYKLKDNLKARGEFEVCAQHIDTYIKNNKYIYQFLLEGFNARYFQNMCNRWQEKLAAGE